MADPELTIVKSEPLPALTIVKSEPTQTFVPANVKEFLDRVGKAAMDVPIGMAKGAGRMIQAIPIGRTSGGTVAEMTDRAYGLPSGASAQAMQPSNDTQRVGGAVGNAALAGAAEVGPAIAGRTIGYVSDPTIVQRVANIARGAADFSGETLNAIKSQLLSGGPPTPEKVASLVVTFGKKAVQAAVVGAGLGGGYSAIRHLFAAE